MTFEKLVTMNYGIDFLVAHVYTGNLTGILQSYVLEQQLTPSGKHIHDDVRKIILEMEEEHVRLPIYCDAFAASGAATKVSALPKFQHNSSNKHQIRVVLAPFLLGISSLRPLLCFKMPLQCSFESQQMDDSMCMTGAYGTRFDCNAVQL